MQLSRLAVGVLTTSLPPPASLTLHILRNLNWSVPKVTSYILLFDEGQSRSSVSVGLASVVVGIETDEGSVVVGVVDKDEEEIPENTGAEMDEDVVDADADAQVLTLMVCWKVLLQH